MAKLPQHFATNFAGAVLLLAFVAGCTPDLPYEVVPLEGTVTYKGEPLENVILHFRPSTGRESMATTTEGGKFVMRYTYDVNGVQTGPGEFYLSPPMESGGLTGGAAKKDPMLIEALRKYSVKGSPHAAQITEPSSDYKLDLK